VWFVVADATPRRRRLAAATAGLTVAGFAGLSFVGAVYLAAQGRAADAMARWVVEHADPEGTDPGPIAHHAGQYFPAEPPARPEFAVVVAPDGGEVLHAEEMRVFGRVVRTYRLVRVPRP